MTHHMLTYARRVNTRGLQRVRCRVESFPLGVSSLPTRVELIVPHGPL
jgi:hypothetical protein